MSDDKMRADFEAWAEDNDCGITLAATSATGFYTRNIAWTAWQAACAAGQKAEQAEVERLRAELAQLRKDWCDDDEAIKQQALRVLDAAKVEGDSVYVPRMGALAEMMADELVKVCAELAAAKAASVVPVKIRELCADGHVGKLAAWCENADAAKQLHGWLRDRMKDNSPPAT